MICKHRVSASTQRKIRLVVEGFEGQELGLDPLPCGQRGAGGSFGAEVE